jgi:hypothetical protein
MKLILLPAALLILTICVHAQNENAPAGNNRYVAAMEKNIVVLDTATSVTTLTELANNFERVASAEKSKWESYYYTAYCYTLIAANTADKGKVDLLTDKAEFYLSKADSLQKDNSEVSALFALVRALQLSVDPMGRYQTLLPEVENYVNMAKKQDTANPRAYLVEARFKLRLPEMMGGGKETAKALTIQALEKFDQFKPGNSIAPRWGQQSAKLLLEKMN